MEAPALSGSWEPEVSSEIARHADFSEIRYGQCWEDADVLMEGLDIQPHHTCLSIASAGDNTLAMLSRGPAKVVAIDLSAAQLACLELRVAAYRELSHRELLMLMGSVTACSGQDSPKATSAGECRLDLYRSCRPLLSRMAREFWDSHPCDIAHGIGGAGKFERYFALFRRRVLPLVHSQSRIISLLERRSWQEREDFYRKSWDTGRWRLLFRLFFSRQIMGRIGRDREFFRYAEGPVAEHILARTRHALTALDPTENPYLHWIVRGHHGAALPVALRPENFEAIRANLDRLTWHCGSIEDYLESVGEGVFDRFNLSDIFEYQSPENYFRLLEGLARAGRPGGRLAYWNLVVERRRPECLRDLLRPMEELADRLHETDKTWFYGAFVLEEIAT